MRIVDNLAAIRLIWLLSTPFEKFDAFKLGLIDEKGKRLKKAETIEEKNATSMLHRLAWNLKRIIALAPGGSTRIGSLVAAYLLVKEAYENDYTEIQLEEAVAEKFQLYRGIRFIEEEAIVRAVLKNLEEEGAIAAPTNSTGAAVSTDQVKTKKKTKIVDKHLGRKALVVP